MKLLHSMNIERLSKMRALTILLLQVAGATTEISSRCSPKASAFSLQQIN